MRIDLHVHTEYSHDSGAKIEDILRCAKHRNLDAIAITDHDTLEGTKQARRIRQSDDVQIIPGVEVTVPGGFYGLHLVALFVEDYRPPQNLREAIEDMKKKGGIVILPHPYRVGTGLFHHLHKGLINVDDVRFVLSSVHYIEGLSHKSSDDEISQTLEYVGGAQHLLVAGTDTHTPENVGLVWTEVDDFAKFRAGVGSTRIAALVKSGWDSHLGSLGPYLVGHEFEMGNTGEESALKKVAKQIRDIIPNSNMRQVLQKKYRQVAARQKRGQIERDVKTSKSVIVSKTHNCLTFIERSC